MTGDPYTFETIGRVRTNDDIILQAEEWRDSVGHRTHIALAVDNESSAECMTVTINTAEEARQMKNLFAAVERRLGAR